MPRKNIILDSGALKILEKMGTRIKAARLRRNIRAEMIADKAGISETTYYAIEKGTPTVSIGTYAVVLAALGLINDLDLIALDEEGKKQYQEQNLHRRKRAVRKKGEKKDDE